MAKKEGNLSDMVTKALIKHKESLESIPMQFGHVARVSKRTRAEKKLYALHQLDLAKQLLRRRYREISLCGD